MSAAMPSRMATAARTAAFRSVWHHTSPDRDGLPWESIGQDDAATIELEALKDERRASEVRGACDKHLEDLREHGALPRNVKLKER
jgi:hypothetical protein